VSRASRASRVLRAHSSIDRAAEDGETDGLGSATAWSEG
jgi:hypothetical protein